MRTSKGRIPASEQVLLRRGLPSEGEASSPTLFIEGYVQTSKNRKIFPAHNEQRSIKRGESS